MDGVLHFLLGNALVATLLALPAAVSMKIFRRPALSHALWILVLLKLVTPSLIHVPIPGYTGYRAANSEDIPQERPSSSELSGGVGTLPAAADFSSAPGSDEAPAQHAAASLRPDARRAFPGDMLPWSRAALWVELIGGLAWFTWAALRIRWFRGLLSQADPAPAELVQEVQQWARRLGLAQCPQVLWWRRIAPPIVFVLGRRATLVLPQDLVARLDSQQLASVLVHELAHLRRGDHWVRLLEVVVTGLYWWHPLVWWSRRELERTEEQACDAWVLWTSPNGGPSYAGVLLQTVDFLSRLRASSCPLASGFGRMTFLKRRLAMVVEGNVPRVVSGWGRLAILALAVAILPLAPAIAASAPSLDEIKAGLRQRHEKIQSLYVETVGETSSPMTKEELDRLPKDRVEKIFAGRKIEYYYASKGENRISRTMETDNSGGFWDVIWCYNGKSHWTRTVQPELGQPRTLLVPPSAPGHMRFIYPNPWCALSVGEAMVGPNIAAERTWEDLFYLDFGGAEKERWTLAAADAIEEIDGARCAVLSGTIEITYKSGKAEEKQFVRHVKCWVDLQRGMALRKWEEYHAQGEGLKRVVNSHFKYFEPGVWIPQEIEIQSLAPTQGDAYPERYRGKLVLSTRIKVTKCNINRVADDVFDPMMKPGDLVLDLRKGNTVRPFTVPQPKAGTPDASRR